jgi:molybdopterin-containing oxidoreductase family membrane subunit
LRKLLGLFCIGILYFVLLFHLTKLYGSQNHAYERFILLDGGVYTWLFWLFQIGLGSLLPLLLLYSARWQHSPRSLVLACLLIIQGAFAQLYVIIIGGQAFPLNLFPGYRVDSSFFDGVINTYSPSLWELLLGCGGLTSALLIALLVVRVLPILPQNLPGAQN